MLYKQVRFYINKNSRLINIIIIYILKNKAKTY